MNVLNVARADRFQGRLSREPEIAVMEQNAGLFRSTPTTAKAVLLFPELLQTNGD